MIELTEQEQKAVDTNPAPRLIDPRTKRAYVLIGADVYDRIHDLLQADDGLNMHQVTILVEQGMAEDDAGDPTLEYYQQKYGKKV